MGKLFDSLFITHLKDNPTLFSFIIILAIYGLIMKGIPFAFGLWMEKKERNISDITNLKIKENEKKEKKEKDETRNKIDRNSAILEFDVLKKNDIAPIQQNLTQINEYLKKMNGSIADVKLSVGEHHADKSIHFEKDMFVKITDCHKLHSEAIDKFDTKVEKIYEKIDSFYGILNKTKDTN